MGEFTFKSKNYIDVGEEEEREYFEKLEKLFKKNDGILLNSNYYFWDDYCYNMKDSKKEDKSKWENLIRDYRPILKCAYEYCYLLMNSDNKLALFLGNTFGLTNYAFYTIDKVTLEEAGKKLIELEEIIDNKYITLYYLKDLYYKNLNKS